MSHTSTRWSPPVGRCSTGAPGGHPALASVIPEHHVVTKCFACATPKSQVVGTCWPVQRQIIRWPPSFGQCNTSAPGCHQVLASVTPEQHVSFKMSCLQISKSSEQFKPSRFQAFNCSNARTFKFHFVKHLSFQRSSVQSTYNICI